MPQIAKLFRHTIVYDFYCLYDVINNTRILYEVNMYFINVKIEALPYILKLKERCKVRICLKYN